MTYIITKNKLLIPRTLDEYFIKLGWEENYWMELPEDWQWNTEYRKSEYPILQVVEQWRKETGTLL